MAVKIIDIEKNSFAEKKKIKPGSTLVSINGHEIIDVLDYRFYQICQKTELIIIDENNKQKKVKIKKDEYDEIGLLFETYLMDKQRSCKNKCIFCFIDQLPKGLRKSLYFKDDDSRLSFLFGNYITLTNLTEHEIARIKEMHITPINVSVHTTNPDLRQKMMGNPNAGKVLSLLSDFRNNGIGVNCQIVVCPGINDGEELKRSLTDLLDLNVNLVAVVPVGLTKHRENLAELNPFNKESSKEVLKIVNSFGETSLKKNGNRVFFCADEFYINAEEEIPNEDFYEDFSAIENGVGMISLLRSEVYEALGEIEKDNKKRHVSIATGVSAAPFLTKLAEKINEKFVNTKIDIFPIKNNFLGELINVAGLTAGKDLIEQLKEKSIAKNLLIPSVMLRHSGDLFLDDVSVEDIASALNVNVIVVSQSGDDLINAILDC